MAIHLALGIQDRYAIGEQRSKDPAKSNDREALLDRTPSGNAQPRAVKREPADTDAKLFDQHPQILAMWHGQFMLLPNLKPGL